MVPCKSTAEEVSFEWSHHRILSTDSKVRTTLHVSVIDSGSERGKGGFIRRTKVVKLKLACVNVASTVGKHVGKLLAES